MKDMFRIINAAIKHYIIKKNEIADIDDIFNLNQQSLVWIEEVVVPTSKVSSEISSYHEFCKARCDAIRSKKIMDYIKGRRTYQRFYESQLYFGTYVEKVENFVKDISIILYR